MKYSQGVILNETENGNSKGIHALMSWHRRSIVIDTPLSGDGYAKRKWGLFIASHSDKMISSRLNKDRGDAETTIR